MEDNDLKSEDQLPQSLFPVPKADFIVPMEFVGRSLSIWYFCFIFS